MFVKILKPRLISSDNGNVSSVTSTSGVSGNSHAATIVMLAAMSGPVIFGPVTAPGSGAEEHAAPPRSATVARTAIGVDLMMQRA